ncbi:hypothetical protein Pcinc_040276 [Petrolisthes cinctipes]|uniref:Uncharacterized protein n=1 Tax=Petrolisthes cinctipes TaxID=88211 RepID=A0AAE1EI65_PETCI|nr:hypothetical protein Pcinc_040276 [Petrolisthes cinctipes]
MPYSPPVPYSPSFPSSSSPHLNASIFSCPPLLFLPFQPFLFLSPSQRLNLLLTPTPLPSLPRLPSHLNASLFSCPPLPFLPFLTLPLPPHLNALLFS